MNREDVVRAIVETGKTREQAEAFLDLLGSAFRRWGMIEGEPLGDEERTAKLKTFLGGPL